MTFLVRWSLMKLNNVSFGISDEKHDTVLGQGDRPLGNWYIQLVDAGLNDRDVCYIERHMGVAGMPFGNVHQNIVGNAGIGIENE